MNTISDYLGADHQRCDAMFARIEFDVAEGHWQQAKTSFQAFNRALERHFSMEETVLFVQFEQATGSPEGPTGIMRKEHQHIREITRRMLETLDRHDADNFYGHADTLRIMMHQHNTKEESVLYLMADRILSNQSDRIIDAMNELNAAVVFNNID